MKRIFTLLLMTLVVAGASYNLYAQEKSLKGSGEVFFYEDFDWADENEARGWSLPEGYEIIDNSDFGWNWVWMAPDSIVALYTAEPPFRSTSSHNGYLALPLNNYNDPYDGSLLVDNDIQFPHFDCSDKSSVILRFETHFMNGGDGANEVWVSNDDGVHWAVFDCGFGTLHKDRPNDASPGQAVVYEANISDVAAGMSDVIIRIHWGETRLYFWVLDDFSLSEAYDNDLKIKHFKLVWDDGNDDTEESYIHDIPISQIGGTYNGFQASVVNFGEFDQDDVTFTVDIKKNHETVFTSSDSRSWLSPQVIDTIDLEGGYTPEEFGHYSIDLDFSQEQEEQNLSDNGKQIFFNVTDSVYSRADDSAELSYAYGFEHYGGDEGEAGWNIEHFIGMIYPIYSDCEVNSISCYINGGLADGNIEFWYTLFYLPKPEDDPDGLGAIQWMTTDIVELDSSQFNTWVTLPFEKDGESEYLLAGDIVYAGIQYNNYNDEPLVRRGKNLGIGHDASVKVNDAVAIGYHNGGWVQSDFVKYRNLMVRLNLNDHSNIIDQVDLTSAIASLDQNYPNPFSGNTTISYELSAASDVTIEVTDITGKQILMINEGQKTAGQHNVSINGHSFEAGVYFYSINAGDYTETKRMIVQ